MEISLCPWNLPIQTHKDIIQSISCGDAGPGPEPLAQVPCRVLFPHLHGDTAFGAILPQTHAAPARLNSTDILFS